MAEDFTYNENAADWEGSEAQKALVAALGYDPYPGASQSRPPRRKNRERTEQEALLQRLRRVEGQVRGVTKMVESGAYCTDILNQVTAIRSALSAFSRELLASHIRTCVVKGLQEGDEEVVEELVRTVERMTKG